MEIDINEIYRKTREDIQEDFEDKTERTSILYGARLMRDSIIEAVHGLKYYINQNKMSKEEENRLAEAIIKSEQERFNND